MIDTEFLRVFPRGRNQPFSIDFNYRTHLTEPFYDIRFILRIISVIFFSFSFPTLTAHLLPRHLFLKNFYSCFFFLKFDYFFGRPEASNQPSDTLAFSHRCVKLVLLSSFFLLFPPCSLHGIFPFFSPKRIHFILRLWPFSFFLLFSGPHPRLFSGVPPPKSHTEIHSMFFVPVSLSFSFRVPSPFFFSGVPPPKRNTSSVLPLFFPGSVPVLSFPEFRLQRVTPKYIQCFRSCFLFLFPGSAPFSLFRSSASEEYTEYNQCFSFLFLLLSFFSERKHIKCLLFFFPGSAPVSLFRSFASKRNQSLFLFLFLVQKWSISFRNTSIVFLVFPSFRQRIPFFFVFLHVLNSSLSNLGVFIHTR